MERGRRIERELRNERVAQGVTYSRSGGDFDAGMSSESWAGESNASCVRYGLRVGATHDSEAARASAQRIAVLFARALAPCVGVGVLAQRVTSA